jgi:hypothetical protein
MSSAMSEVNIISVNEYVPLREFRINFTFILIRSIPHHVLKLQEITICLKHSCVFQEMYT